MTLDFNRSVNKEHAASDAINSVLNASLRKANDSQGRRTYVGASAIGGECARALQFEYAGAKKEKEFPDLTLRKFQLGHHNEELARWWFKDAGFNLVQKTEKGPFRFSELDGRFAGTPDGVFLSGPAITGVGYPCLWECKSVGSKTYKQIEKDGLKKARFTYFAQVQIYMAYLDLMAHPTIFTVTNLDTGEQLHLLIPFDGEVAQAMSDRAVQIIKATEAGDLLPRAFNDQSHFICKWCSFSERCWGMET